MTRPGRVLVVDDDRSMCDLLEDAISGDGHEVVATTRAAEALARLQADAFDLVLTDLRMADLDGLELCRRARELRPDVPVIVLTGFGDLQAAVAAMRAGAYDFLSKPVELDTLAWAVTRALRHRALTREVRELRERARERTGPGGLIGDSAAMRRVFELLPRAARSDVPVLITGETGTGKELAARAIHDLGPRAAEPFVAVNCAALPPTLVEAELFGHVRGAFTDARADRVGLLAEAGRGTLFLDEVGELPPLVQPKLLRALQERVVRPVGANREVPIHCRLVSATNRDLRGGDGFREDLYYRLAVISLEMPPLRARAGDILLLAQHFVERAAARSGRAVSGMGTPVAQALLAHGWPGNVRELENCMERAVALTEHDRLVLDDLPDELRAAPTRAPAAADDALRPLDDVEREHILAVLRALDGNKSTAADVLGIDRRTLYRKLERYGVP